jgi:hypothetical protein
MCTNSQLLIIIGLVFELTSVLYQARKVFHPFMSKKEKKLKYIEDNMMAKEISKAITKREKEWFWTVLLLFIGLLLQGIAEFV